MRKPLEIVLGNCSECSKDYSILGYVETTGKEKFYDCSMLNCRKVKVA